MVDYRNSISETQKARYLTISSLWAHCRFNAGAGAFFVPVAPPTFQEEMVQLVRAKTPGQRK